MSLILALALAQTCHTYSIRCDCFPAVPFEGFKLYVVETCDSKEEWSTDYSAPSFDTALECQAATKTNAVCLNLPRPPER